VYHCIIDIPIRGCAFMQTWRATHRTSQGKYRVNMITSEGNVNKGLEFFCERDYWGFIGALKRVV
jgi:hypothetical protein